ncbi:hypothetical protein [Microbacterium sp. C7(2022)]|uniref:hypothetical protein n=1 Tax=Microbacterium sp. C7(2022) TaxID=2992759 RepID=UPI00237B9907|nr:hypothetical protein [Microbacterium sp. C7(2022)]MDE0547291.1 hypothetical protein [Microbacterium sp. C7(2022)]
MTPGGQSTARGPRPLERVLDWIVARGTLVTAVLLFTVGAALLIVGVVRVT